MTILSTIRAATLLAFSSLLITGCDNQAMQDEFAVEALSPPADFTQTDENGEILSDGDQLLEDPNDWRTAPAFPPQAVRVSPAYPNPVRNGNVNILVTIYFDSEVYGGLFLSRRDASGDLFRLQSLPSAGGVGTFGFSVPASNFGSRGLHRVIIITGTGDILSYGDVQVE